MDFASLTAKSFFLQIHAPNGESSELMDFSTYGSTGLFSPKSSGCGHGDWIFEISVKENNKYAFLAKNRKMCTLNENLWAIKIV